MNADVQLQSTLGQAARRERIRKINRASRNFFILVTLALASEGAFIGYTRHKIHETQKKIDALKNQDKHGPYQGLSIHPGGILIPWATEGRCHLTDHPERSYACSITAEKVDLKGIY